MNFTNHMNPSALYNNNNNNNAGPFDVNNQFAQQNGHAQTFSTPQSQQTFNPNSVVPAKRPHDNMSETSRSQTPSFFPGQQPQQFSNAPTPYAHLQQPGSNNASPSPTMSNTQFRPPGQPHPRMSNASPSPFPGQQQGAFGGQISPSTPQPGQIGGAWNPSLGMPPGMSTPGMPSAMHAQIANMAGQGIAGQQMAQAQRNYQQQLLQQQRRMQQSGMVGPRPVGGQPSQMGNFGGHPQQPSQMPNGQAGNPTAMSMQQQQQQQQQQHHAKRAGFLKTLMSQAQQQGRQFNPSPTIGNRVVDLYMLWTVIMQAGSSNAIDRGGRWQSVANKMGFSQPNAGAELKQVHMQSLGQYERMWLSMKAQQKQEQVRMHAQQMAGLSGPTQGSPTRTMQPPGQQNQINQFPPGQPGQQAAQASPVQANAQNGINTPQIMHHRRNSSLRKPEPMTPQSGNQPITAPSPQSMQNMQSPLSLKQQPPTAAMKSEEVQSTNYLPHINSIEYDGGYDMNALYELGTTISRVVPNMPSVDEMGVIDVKAIALSLASGLHAEVRYALDMLAIVSNDPRISFDLEKCENLMDIIVDFAEEQTELLSDDAVEVSDALDLPSYEDIMRGSKIEAGGLQELAEFGTSAYELDRAADRVIAITTIIRNFSFYEFNHQLLTSAQLIKWVCNTIRLLGTRNMLLRTHFNTQDFYKDMITFLSNITQSLELPSRDDALHILQFLLAFAPQPSPSYVEHGRKIRFTSFVPTVHRYLPPAVDCLAKLLARQDPNRMLYKSIFTASGSSLVSSESPLDLLTRAFGLAISVLPDRSRGSMGNIHQLRIVEARKASLSQGMLAADILTSLAPGNDIELARSWIESEDGWAVSLLNLAALLCVDRSGAPGPKGQIGYDTETFKLISHRSLAMIKRLAGKAGKGFASAQPANGANGNSHDHSHDAEDGGKLKGEGGDDEHGWEGIPQSHAVIGALMMPNSDRTAVGLMCNLYEFAT